MEFRSALQGPQFSKPAGNSWERIFVTSVSILILLSCAYWLKDLGEPGRPLLLRWLAGIVSGGLLTAGLFLSLRKTGKRFWYLQVLILLPSSLAAAFAMTAYGWFAGGATLFFYLYVAYLVWKRNT